MMYRPAAPHGRHCPRCTYPLNALPAGQVHVDHCYRCGGSYFDFGDAQAAIGWHADPRVWRPEAFARPPMQGRLPCPDGHGPMWSYLLAWEGKNVEIDICGHCHGMWLDAHEAEALHAITAETHAEVSNQAVGIDVRAELFGERHEAFTGFVEIDGDALNRLVAEYDVLQHRQVVRQHEVLMHHPNARRDR